MIDPAEYADEIKRAALRHDVSTQIQKNDFIFQFLVSNPSFKDIAEAIDYYFDDGARSREKLTSLISIFDGGIAVNQDSRICVWLWMRFSALGQGQSL